MKAIPDDCIKRNPDMDKIGRLAGNGRQGKVLPFRFTFNAVTRYMIIFIW